MSSQPNLPTADEVLEEPQTTPPTSGLIPRKGLLVAIVLFVLLLASFAVYDVVLRAKPKATQTESKTSMAIEAVGPPPAPKEISTIAVSQEAKAAQSNAAISAKVNAPADVNTGTNPVVQSASNSDTASRPISAAESAQLARDQRDAAASVSNIFAFTGADAASLTQQAASLLEGGPQALTQRIPQGQPFLPQDPTGEIVRAMSAMQAPQAPRGSRDQQFLRDEASTKPADAVYAKPPASDWMVFQGTRVPIVTREAVNSDLPGTITAITTSPVYDGINQCAVLIPQGSKLIGAYSSDIRPGQSRVLLAFRRMIFPDGRSVELDGAQAADSLGRSGSEGDVNNHFLKMFGYGFALALVADRASASGAPVTVSQPGGQSTTTTVAGQVLADLAGRILTRNANIPPTITMDIGTRMFVTIVRDIALSPVSRNNCK